MIFAKATGGQIFPLCSKMVRTKLSPGRRKVFWKSVEEKREIWYNLKP
jgi:hypothetical protein